MLLTAIRSPSMCVCVIIFELDVIDKRRERESCCLAESFFIVIFNLNQSRFSENDKSKVGKLRAVNCLSLLSTTFFFVLYGPDDWIGYLNGVDKVVRRKRTFSLKESKFLR